MVGYGLIAVIVGLIFRMITSFLVVMGGDLNIKERLFVALAWLPKATVQVCSGENVDTVTVSIHLTFSSWSQTVIY